jgi:hypothetical protein
MTYDSDEFTGALKSYQVVAKLPQRHPVENETGKFVGITGQPKPLNARLKIPDSVVPHTERGDVWNLRFLERSVDVAFFVDIFHVWSPVILDENNLLVLHVVRPHWPSGSLEWRAVGISGRARDKEGMFGGVITIRDHHHAEFAAMRVSTLEIVQTVKIPHGFAFIRG